MIQGKEKRVYVLKRPGVDEFLEEMSKAYEIVIYTASTSNYANPLLDVLDPKRLAPYRLFKEHCTILGNLITKNLARLGRDLKDVIILDNSPIAYILQPGNAIPITTWIDNKEDNELSRLTPILKALAKVSDVRDTIKKIMKEDKVDYESAVEVIEKELRMREGSSRKQPVKLISNLEPKKSKAMHALNSKYKLTKKYSEEIPTIRKSECFVSKGMPVKPVYESKISFSESYATAKPLIVTKQSRNVPISTTNLNKKMFSHSNIVPYPSTLNFKKIESSNALAHRNYHQGSLSSRACVQVPEKSVSGINPTTAGSSTPRNCSNVSLKMTRANSVDIYKTSYGHVEAADNAIRKEELSKDKFSKTHSAAFGGKVETQRKAQGETYIFAPKLLTEARKKNEQSGKAMSRQVSGSMHKSSLAIPRAYGVYPCQILLNRNSWMHKY
eukprot:TRINITY_DN1252_c0_g3_i2.p1 TRINITY_DN1252_c0_g3~~TRINITY_DN1252_c0_g3_i2.p1  ORF type:complete len:442 (+),score=99.63 TRINITY_DN1252_c0_g3_i2:577-1902(+)